MSFIITDGTIALFDVKADGTFEFGNHTSPRVKRWKTRAGAEAAFDRACAATPAVSILEVVETE